MAQKKKPPAISFQFSPGLVEVHALGVLLLDFLLGLRRDLHLGPQLLRDAVEGRQVASVQKKNTDFWTGETMDIFWFDKWGINGKYIYIIYVYMFLSDYETIDIILVVKLDILVVKLWCISIINMVLKYHNIYIVTSSVYDIYIYIYMCVTYA